MIDEVYLTTLLSELSEIRKGLAVSRIDGQILLDQLRIRIGKQIRELQKEETKA